MWYVRLQRKSIPHRRNIDLIKTSNLSCYSTDQVRSQPKNSDKTNKWKAAACCNSSCNSLLIAQCSRLVRRNGIIAQSNEVTAVSYEGAALWSLTSVPNLSFDALAIRVSHHHRRELHSDSSLAVGSKTWHSPVWSLALVLTNK